MIIDDWRIHNKTNIIFEDEREELVTSDGQEQVWDGMGWDGSGTATLF